MTAELAPAADAARRYIELLKGCVSRELFIAEEPHDVRLS